MANPQFEIVLPKDVKKKVDDWCGSGCYTIVGHWNVITGEHLVTVLVGSHILSLRLFECVGDFKLSQDNIYKISIEMKKEESDLYKVVLK